MNRMGPVGASTWRCPYVATNAMNPAPGTVLAARAATMAGVTSTFMLAGTPAVYAHNGDVGGNALQSEIDPTIGVWMGMGALAAGAAHGVAALLNERLGVGVTSLVGAGLGVIAILAGQHITSDQENYGNSAFAGGLVGLGLIAVAMERDAVRWLKDRKVASS